MTTDEEKWETIAEASRRLKRKRTNLTAQIERAGLVPDEKKRYKVSEITAALDAAAGRDLRNKSSGNTDAKTKKLKLEAQLLKIKLDEAKGRVIDADAAAEAWQRVGVSIKNDLLALAQSLPPMLVGKTDLAEMATIIDGRIRDALRHITEKMPDATG